MRKYFATLAVMLGLCVGASVASAQVPRLVVKNLSWQTYGPAGPTGTAVDTLSISGADGVDTTAVVDISDAVWTLADGTANKNLSFRIWIVPSATIGYIDDVDSLYIAVDPSVNGVSFATQSSANVQNGWQGSLAGSDGTAAAGTLTQAGLAATIRFDPDVPDGAGTTGSLWLAPRIRIRVKLDDTSTNAIIAGRAYISYLAWR